MLVIVAEEFLYSLLIIFPIVCLFVLTSHNSRLRASGRPYVAYHPGLLRDTLAFHGCAELFQVCMLTIIVFQYYLLTLV